MSRGCRFRAGLDAGNLCESPRYYFLSPSLSGVVLEGGSSDVAVKLLGCVRVQLSRGRRKQGIKRGGTREPGEGSADGPCRPDETRVVHTADGHTDAQTWRAPRRKTTKRNYYGTSNGR